MSAFDFYKRILHQTLLQLQRVLDMVVPSFLLFDLYPSGWKLIYNQFSVHQLKSINALNVQSWQLIAGMFISAMYTTIYGDTVINYVDRIYSLCCNWTSLCSSRMRLCDWRQCECCSTYFQLKTFGYFNKRILHQTLMQNTCSKLCRSTCSKLCLQGCRHSLLHVERGQGMVRYL